MFQKKNFISKVINTLSFAFLVWTVLSIFAPSAHSADFYTQSSYIVNYTLSDTSASTVYQIREKNLSDRHRIVSRTIVFPFDVDNISAKADGRSLKVNSNYDGENSTIIIYFDQVVFGAGSTMDWTLSFDIPGGVRTSGLLRYFFLTGFEAGDQTQSYKVFVNVPNTFGKLNYISATDYDVTSSANSTRYEFNAGATGLSPNRMIFGEFQAYDFTYNYDVNPVASFEFTIPADRYNQRIIFSEIEPSPAVTVRDTDGNYIVKYTPEALEGAKNVTISGTALVYPSDVFLTDKAAQAQHDISQYLKADEYWESNDINIINKANELTAGLETNIQKAYSIYNFVSQTLIYEKNIILSEHDRKGAAVSILSPEGSVCQEFSDLYIALARAAGVPAREVAGFADDIRAEDSSALTLHSWVEFWDDETGWLMADPTWGGSTQSNYFGKLGSDHFVMVIRGIDSIEPTIVASFENTNTEDKAIDINATSVAPTVSVGADFSAVQNKNLPSITYTLTNIGNVALTIQRVQAQVDGLMFEADFPSDQKQFIALPFSHVQGNISTFRLHIPTSLINTAEVTLISGTLFEPNIENSASIETNNYWIILPILVLIVSILALALLIHSVVKWIRK